MNIVKSNIKFKNPLQKRITTNKIIIHHADAKECDAETINKWHIARGWNGIGYHFVVRKNGTIEEGRPIDTVGAHCTGQNVDSIGICFEGNFEVEHMEDLQLQTGKELIAYLRGKYGDIRVTKHRDFMATSCPGKNFPFDELVKKTKVKKKKYSGTLPTLKKGECIGKGDKGEKVRLLQLFLNWYGNYGLVVDSDCGQRTESAIRNYQLSERLKVDGCFGEKSLAKAKKVKK